MLCKSCLCICIDMWLCITNRSSQLRVHLTFTAFHHQLDQFQQSSTNHLLYSVWTITRSTSALANAYVIVRSGTLAILKYMLCVCVTNQGYSFHGHQLSNLKICQHKCKLMYNLSISTYYTYIHHWLWNIILCFGNLAEVFLGVHIMDRYG